MDELVKDRNEAFSSMDKEKIIAYCNKYKIEIPEDEEIFWAGVHKIICNLYFNEDHPISTKQYMASYEWLTEKGYSPSISGGDE